MAGKRKSYVRGLSPKQEVHLEFIKRAFNNIVDPKYRKGAKEHGGNLWQRKQEDILNWAIEEAIDQVVYLLTLKTQLYDYK